MYPGSSTFTTAVHHKGAVSELLDEGIDAH